MACRTGIRTPQADVNGYYATVTGGVLAGVCDDASLMRELSVFRRRIMVRIAGRRRCRWWTMRLFYNKAGAIWRTLIVGPATGCMPPVAANGNPCNPGRLPAAAADFRHVCWRRRELNFRLILI